MKRYISALAILAVLGLIVFSFKTGNSKIGPRLSYLLNNTSENNFVVWIYLRDKGPDVNSKLQNPLSLVTQRSLDRRSKVKAQNELVDITDVPLYQGYVDEISPKVINVRQQAKWFNSLSCEITREQLDALEELGFITQIEIVERYRKKPDEETALDNSSVLQNQTDAVDSLNYGTTLNE